MKLKYPKEPSYSITFRRCFPIQLALLPCVRPYLCADGIGFFGRQASRYQYIICMCNSFFSSRSFVGKRSNLDREKIWRQSFQFNKWGNDSIGLYSDIVYFRFLFLFNGSETQKINATKSFLELDVDRDFLLFVHRIKNKKNRTKQWKKVLYKRCNSDL